MHDIYVVSLVLFWGLVAGSPELWSLFGLIGAFLASAFFLGRWSGGRDKNKGGGE
jgi:hypothetical protein